MDEWKKHPRKGFTCIQTPVIQCCVTTEHKEGNRDKHGRHNARRLDVWMTKSRHALQALGTGNMQCASRQALMEGHKSVSQQQQQHFYLIFICQQTCSIILSTCYLCCLFSCWSISHAGPPPLPKKSISHSHSRWTAARVSPWWGRHPVSCQLILPTSCCPPPAAAPVCESPAGPGRRGWISYIYWSRAINATQAKWVTWLRWWGSCTLVVTMSICSTVSITTSKLHQPHFHG